MRKTLLASATLFGLAFVPAAFAQTPAPDATAPAGTDAGTAGQTPSGSAGTNAPSATQPAPRHYHHRVAQADPQGEHWAHQPGTGQSGPASARASNIDSGDAHSEIAPHLPQPAGGENAGPWNYLRDAERALDHHETGRAQQALEMAETRLLDRSTPVNEANQPDQGPVVAQVSQARQALGHGDIRASRSAIALALTHAPQGGGEPGASNPAVTGIQTSTQTTTTQTTTVPPGQQ